MFQTVSEILQYLLKIEPSFSKIFLSYPDLKDLFLELFIKLSARGNYNNKAQEAFCQVLSVLFEVIQTFTDKSFCSNLFQILFEDVLFIALTGPEASFIVITFSTEILQKYNLKAHFDCNIDVSKIMVQLIQLIKSYQGDSISSVQENKIQACFYILKHHLINCQEQLEYFGQDLGLINEILSEGIFKTSTANEQEEPKYQSREMMKEAFETLSVLSRNEKNLITIIDFLLPIHQKSVWRSGKSSSWALSANIKRRCQKYSGLKNLGCTCYMNSTIQQLFLIPTFRKHFLQIDDPKFAREGADDNILFQLKRLFYGMNHIDKEYFSPKPFCVAFKDIDGSPTSFSEQKDAFEFLSLLIDRLEEQTKESKHKDFLKAHFGGLLSNELICKECPHYYEREEPFLAINLVVKNKKSITDSLERLIEGEVLDGDNAYYCEQCKMKVKTVKRMSVKKLPNYLFFSLQRFEYNFDLNIRVKVNDFCEFPLKINMQPYTQAYLKKTEKIMKKASGDATSADFYNNSRSVNDSPSNYEYELKGIVIHMGTAESGHYYSIIRDQTTDSEGNKVDEWLEFNDTKVSEFNIKELPKTAYGEGEGYRSFQSAYVLLYEKKNLNEDLKVLEEEFEAEERQIQKPASTDLDIERPIPKYLRDEQTSMEDLKEEIKKKNMKFFYISNIFSVDYINFIFNLTRQYDLVQRSPERLEKTQSSENSIQVEDSGNKCSQKIFEFIWTVYCTTIVRTNNKKLQQKQFFEWMYDKLNQEHRRLLISLLQRAFRRVYISEQAQEDVFGHDDEGYAKSVTANFLRILINLLESSRIHLKKLNDYFLLFLSLTKIDINIIQYLLSNELIGRLGCYFFQRDYSYLEDDDNPFSTLPVQEEEVSIHYNEDILTRFKKHRSDDFYNSNITNLTYLFRLLWKLLSYSVALDRKNHEKYLYHKTGIDYSLSAVEDKIFNLESNQIVAMFDSIDPDNTKALDAICKIIGFASYESMPNSQSCLTSIEDEFGSEKQNRHSKDYLGLIQLLAKLDDRIHKKRTCNLIILLVESLTERSDSVYFVKMYTFFLQKLIQTNETVRDFVSGSDEICDKIIEVLRQHGSRQNSILSNSYYNRKPINYQAAERLRKEVERYVEFFEQVKDEEIPDTRDDASEGSNDAEEIEYKKGQQIEF